jgi:hypothetical protein
LGVTALVPFREGCPRPRSQAPSSAWSARTKLPDKGHRDQSGAVPRAHVLQG